VRGHDRRGAFGESQEAWEAFSQRRRFCAGLVDWISEPG
jgi:hypothetical protein